MAISKKFKEIIDKANETNNKQLIIDENERLKAKNFKTYLTTLYSVKKLVKDEWKAEFTPSTDEIQQLEIDFPKKVNHTEYHINIDVLEDIVKRKIYDFRAKFTYLLLITGRRISELIESDYKIEDNKFYIKTKKHGITDIYDHVKILLNNDANEVDALLKDARSVVKMLQTVGVSEIGVVNRINSYIKSCYGFTPHKFRSIYIAYIDLYLNPHRLSKGDLITISLNHHGIKTSASGSYDSCIIDNSKNLL